MKESIKLGDVFYVFTNWGICKGCVRKIVVNEFGIQYKLDIDIDECNLGKKYGFFYTEEQLFSDAMEAVEASISKHKLSRINQHNIIYSGYMSEDEGRGYLARKQKEIDDYTL